MAAINHAATNDFDIAITSLPIIVLELPESHDLHLADAASTSCIVNDSARPGGLAHRTSALTPPADRDRAQGHRIAISSIVLFEWLRGPRQRAELAAQESLLPRESAAPFTAVESALAADLYKALSKPRGREIDLTIAACALSQGAALWTLSHDDFRDIPNLQLL